MIWRWDEVLKTHPNGMRFSVFDEDGTLLATNEYFSVGGGFVVNDKTKVDENLFYKGVDKRIVHGARLAQSHSQSDSESDSSTSSPAQPPYPFTSGDSLLALTRNHNLTIAQIVYDNERHFGLGDDEIRDKIKRIWSVMDDCIRMGVTSAEDKLPGRLGLRRRAPMLYRRLMRGFYPGLATPSLPAIGPGSMQAPQRVEAPEGFVHSDGGSGRSEHGRKVADRALAARATYVVGSLDHPVLPMPPRKTMIPAMDFLSCYAIAVNEFVSDDPEKSVETFLLTAAAVGMLFKRGSTISAAEGGCQAEVGVACSMASAGFAACMGATPETVLQAAEIGIEHNLGLTCDPIDGLVQVPCIERNSLGAFAAVKAVTAAQLSMASHGVYSVTLDEAIEAMRLTAADMSVKYKETSLSGLARTVKIPLTMPNC
ncbi:hypothetical protein EUX98_g1817 [Antrodiella citrinella]|uniref:Serine dehydratase-like alpha subunit domain-containing protein n=1 Tax=Antrodiella citrinella TaxID=2447956 RepID=A0A4S4N0K4_9APHY|nr:hypothetical protein EUX98_g1817 [Antrodiella citrinella]